jgi:ATP-dependent 26S proteasome regulatory subunit
MFGEDVLASLRAALAESPANLPLRLHLSETLLTMGRGSEAESEFKSCVGLSPRNAQALLGLARSYWQQKKTSQAIVVVEDLIQQRDAPGAAFVLYSRLLLAEGRVLDAVAQYKRAIELAPDAGDPELADQLGVGRNSERSDVIGGRQRLAPEGADDSPDLAMESPGIKFADVGGMEEVKEEISLKIIYPLQHPELYKAYGKKAGGGILLYGPPGCGKTYLARATAGQIAASFIPIAIHDVLDMWIGSSERNIHAIFEQARLNRPCVLFFDEVDALGGKRSDFRQASGRTMVNQFLVELDGLSTDNSGLLVLAATNAPWHVDSAFRRPGRFDRIIFVPPPDVAARAEIIRLHCQDKPARDLDFARLAGKTEGFSGADLKSLVDRAVEEKLRAAMKAGGLQPLTTADLLHAAKQFKPSVREWFSTAKNYALYSNQDGSYDDVLKYLKLK